MSPVEETIKSMARHVMRMLGRGHTERIYHNSMLVCVRKSGLQYRTQVPCPIFFQRECVGYSEADMVVDDLIVEFKAVTGAPREASAQLQKYITSLTQIEKRPFRGMVVNFNAKYGIAQFWLEEERLPPPPKTPVPALTDLERLAHPKRISSLFQRSLRPRQAPPMVAKKRRLI